MLRITPNSPVEDVVGPRAVVSRAHVDDLLALTRNQHRLDLLRRDGWDIREFRLLKRTRRRNLACIDEACLDCGPVDIAHKSGDMGGRVGAVLDGYACSYMSSASIGMAPVMRCV